MPLTPEKISRLEGKPPRKVSIVWNKFENLLKVFDWRNGEVLFEKEAYSLTQALLATSTALNGSIMSGKPLEVMLWEVLG